jgi:hypothetical protein
MPNGRQHTRAVFALFLISVLLCVYRLSPAHSIRIVYLMRMMPRDHGVSPAHSIRIVFLMRMMPRDRCVVFLMRMVPGDRGVLLTHSCCTKCISSTQFRN